VTQLPNRVPPKRKWRARLRQMRQLYRLLQTLDVRQLDRLIGEFRDAQLALEARQRELRATVGSLAADVATWKQGLLPDSNLQTLAMLNIKNLGYEIGRALAEQQFNKPIPPSSSQRLTSKICTQSDFSEDWMYFWFNELKVPPFFHRKFWEYCYVCQALFAEGKLAPGQSGLGFGCGTEPLPSVFVKYGAHVLATDLDQDRIEAEAWRLSKEHAASAEALRHRHICADEERLADIHFRSVDMNAIPSDLDGQFDFCWSTCAFEHLGTLANGLAFVENSLRTLRPGGVAVHTTEFTFDCGETIDNNPTVIYQEQHLTEFVARLRDQGYQVSDLDLASGSGVLDCFVDLPPFSHDLLLLRFPNAHLKLAIDGYTCTSVGLIIRKP
jgi:SAM-dependent methyltransferase